MRDEVDAIARSRHFRNIAIWDLPTRLFHWSLAVLFVALWITGTEPSMIGLHIWIGEAVLAMLLFRLIWGFVGSRHSRFADFVAGPRAAFAHLKEIIAIACDGPAAESVHTPPHIGHTRLGGWMILALLSLLFLECVTGLFSIPRPLASAAPLNHLVSRGLGRIITIIHSGTFNVLMALVIIHICAALFYLVRKRENLILPLITGRADVPDAAAVRERGFQTPYLAVALMIFAVLLVWGIVSL